MDEILNKSNSEEHFDIILVQIGANDVIRMTPMDDIEVRVTEVINRLKKQTDKIAPRAVLTV